MLSYGAANAFASVNVKSVKAVVMSPYKVEGCLVIVGQLNDVVNLQSVVMAKLPVVQ
jgi:hypothetical protein